MLNLRTLLLIITLTASTAHAQVALDAQTFTSAGGQNTTANYRLFSTFAQGQPIGPPMSTNTFRLQSGFLTSDSVVESIRLKLEPITSQVSTGEDITVNVRVENAPGISAFEFQIRYDNNILRIDDSSEVQPGPFLTSTGREIHPVGPTLAEGSVKYAVASSGSEALPDGSGTLATITFTAVGEGETALALTGVKLLDLNTATVTVIPVDSSIVVGDALSFAPQATAVRRNSIITVKTTPPGSPRVWNIIAPSVRPDESSLEKMFQSLLGGADTWIAWRWDAALNQWEVGSPTASSGRFGIASPWVFAVEGDEGEKTVTLTGTAIESSKPYPIPLKAGWNLIVNPFAFPVAWSDETLKVHYSGQELSVTQALANGWVDNRAIWYDNLQRRYVTRFSNESQAYIMPPHRGQWLYSEVNGAELIISPIEAVDAPASTSAPSENEPVLWKVVFSVQSQDGDDQVEATVSTPDRPSHRVRLNTLKPPLPPGDTTPRINFVIERPNRTSLQSAVDTQPLAEQMVWSEITVFVPAQASLSWTLSAVPPDYTLYLEDITTGQTLSLKQEHAQILPGSDRPHRFRFKAAFHPIPKTTRLLNNYPNPFNPETWIPYELAAAADVTIQIYNIEGQRIRTLALGHQAPGEYRTREKAAHWNGRNSVGEMVASGVYFYEMTAGAFRSVRRMVILK